MNFLQLAEKVIREERRPLTLVEIWDIGKKYKDTKGKTPWITIGAQIHSDIRYNEKTIFEKIESNPIRFYLNTLPKGEIEDIYGEVSNYIKSHGNNISSKKNLSHYAFKKDGTNFIGILKRKRILTLLLKLNPKPNDIVNGFTEDISGGIGNEMNFDPCLRVYIKNEADFEKAKSLIKRAYNEN